jgi:hypothetical protein
MVESSPRLPFFDKRNLRFRMLFPRLTMNSVTALMTPHNTEGTLHCPVSTANHELCHYIGDVTQRCRYSVGTNTTPGVFQRDVLREFVDSANTAGVGHGALPSLAAKPP